MTHVSELINSDNKKVVMHQTWGHLFPTEDYYEGVIRIGKSIYQKEVTILDEHISGIEGSPWWYSTVYDFAYKFSARMKEGEVWDVWISVTRVEYEDEEGEYDHEELHIQTLKSKVRVNIMEV